MHDSSIFNIRIDFEKSHDSYIYDKNRRRYFLDFFGLYASLPLGYNHEIFREKEFIEEYRRTASVKVTNCEIISDEAQKFLKVFSGHKAMARYEYFHFCCTGALAIEAAIKAAIDQKGSTKPIVLSLKESFHGINSYGGFVTDRFFPVSTRLDGFPQLGWQRLHNPKIIYRNDDVDGEATQRGLEKFLSEFRKYVERYGKRNIVALLIEPIQSTYGDNYFPAEFFSIVRKLCDRHDIALIFDEIQTGLGGTGKMWYSQHFGIEPDIVVFGKKAQVAGIMCKKYYGKIFKTPIRLEVTWDADLSDMIRGRYVLKAYEKYEILKNVNQRSYDLIQGLKEIDGIKNVRVAGLLAAFDFDSGSERDVFFDKMVNKGFICNKTRDRTIRLRPPLSLSSAEVEIALGMMKNACRGL